MAVNSFLAEKVLDKSAVNDADAKAYYDAHPNAFKQPGDSKDAMRASHILIMVKKDADAQTQAAAKAKAEKLLAMLKQDPSRFGELAEKESGCPSGKAGKGSLGAFEKGQMVPEFENAVINLKPGELSGIVKTQFGYHIIRRDALEGAKTKTFAEVKDQLKEFLKQKKNQEALLAFVKQITEKAKAKNYIK
ncbi:MAG: peptidylprolyl isomerase [Victivallaceae bacterium]|nr:peptidylprolyl isomerase [Victivallaceae bacterium]